MTDNPEAFARLREAADKREAGVQRDQKRDFRTWSEIEMAEARSFATISPVRLDDLTALLDALDTMRAERDDAKNLLNFADPERIAALHERADRCDIAEHRALGAEKQAAELRATLEVIRQSFSWGTLSNQAKDMILLGLGDRP